jgi:hypothetical protein
MQKVRRKLILGALPLALAAPSAFAQFGGLMGGRAGGGGGNVDADINNFMASSFNVERTASRAYLAIAGAFASEEERAKLQALLSDVNSLTNPQESGAKLQQVIETTDAAIKRASEEKNLDEQVKNMSADKQKRLGAGVGNLLLAAFQGSDLLTTGQRIVSGVGANPMAVTKLPPLRDALTRLGKAVSTAGSAMPKLVNALKGANVSVAPASSSSKEEKIESV